jgi:DNA-binding transcriptional regulator YiaG
MRLSSFQVNIKNELTQRKNDATLSHMELTTGERIAIMRKRKGLTQAELAERLGKSQSWVHHLEGGRAKLTLDDIKALSAELEGLELG